MVDSTKDKDKEIVFFIDMQQFKTKEKELSVRTLLQDFAEEDPAQTTLVYKHGNDQEKYTDLAKIIKLKNGMKFVVFHNTPTTVSSTEVQYGPPRLKADLKSLGYEVEVRQGTDNAPYIIIPNYHILVGRFAGRIIDLGIQATPDFPRSVASAIHVKASPQLFDYSDSLQNVRNIVESKLGGEWRYWSKNFRWTPNQSARRLMSQINEVFANA